MPVKSGTAQRLTKGDSRLSQPKQAAVSGRVNHCAPRVTASPIVSQRQRRGAARQSGPAAADGHHQADRRQIGEPTAGVEHDPGLGLQGEPEQDPQGVQRVGAAAEQRRGQRQQTERDRPQHRAGQARQHGVGRQRRQRDAEAGAGSGPQRPGEREQHRHDDADVQAADGEQVGQTDPGHRRLVGAGGGVALAQQHRTEQAGLARWQVAVEAVEDPIVQRDERRVQPARASRRRGRPPRRGNRAGRRRASDPPRARRARPGSGPCRSRRGRRGRRAAPPRGGRP